MLYMGKGSTFYIGLFSGMAVNDDVVVILMFFFLLNKIALSKFECHTGFLSKELVPFEKFTFNKCTMVGK